MSIDVSVLEALQRSFGLPSFREGQEEIIEAILEGRDVIAVMPTGGGKSLCFQLPALLLPGLTIVVSPLIALMKDQVDALLDRGLPATFINSTLSPEEQGRRLTLATAGRIKLLYVAPERFRSLQFTRTVAAIDVSLFAVDEAHCLSQWGHDFRPDYLRLPQGIAAVGRPPVAAFTATATREVREDIAANLKLEDPAVFFAGIERENLFLKFEFPAGRGVQEKKAGIILKAIRRNKGQAGIVYTATRKNVERVTERLQHARIQAMAYHAGLSDDQRAEAQNRFMKGDVQVMVATNAFGMGVDKSDIRYVIHHDFPGSIEAYYQEVGRAGRDGKPAECLTLFAETDRFVQEFFHMGSNPPRDLIEKVHQVLKSVGAATIELTVAQLTERVGKDASDMAVSTSLKVLERYGVISRGYRGEARCYVRLLRALPEVREALSRAPVQLALIEALPAVAVGALDTGAQVALGSLAYEAGLARDQVSRVLNELHRSGYVDYEPPFRGRSTHLLIRDGALPVDWAVLEEKEQRDHQKIEIMLAFARTRACRKWYLRRYFVGEGGDEFQCGACDRCKDLTDVTARQAAEDAEATLVELEGGGARQRRRKRPLTRGRTSSETSTRSAGSEAGSREERGRPAPVGSPTSQLEAVVDARVDGGGNDGLTGDALKVVQKVLSCVARMRGRFGRQRVAQVLKGSKEKDILRWGLDRLSTYGLLADMRLDDIIAVIDHLSASGLLRSEILERARTHRVAVIGLTELGRGVMRGATPARISLPPGLLPGVKAGGGVSAGSSSRGGQPDDATEFKTGSEEKPYSLAIYDAICTWRTARARAESTPAYVILHNKTARELARVKPTSQAALREVKGMGPTRCLAFGEELLSIIHEQLRLGKGG